MSGSSDKVGRWPTHHGIKEPRRVAPVPVRSPDHAEGAPGPWQLGTGDGSTTPPKLFGWSILAVYERPAHPLSANGGVSLASPSAVSGVGHTFRRSRRWSFLKMRWSAFGCVISLQSLVTWSCRSTCICWSMSQGAGFYPEPFRPSSCRFRCAAAKDPFGRRIITISTSHRTRSSWRSCATFIAIPGSPAREFCALGWNPVKRGLVIKPEEWLWSSYRHYQTGMHGTVEIESEWTACERGWQLPAWMRNRQLDSLSPVPKGEGPGAPST
jgi:hypothetical protein